MLRSTTCLVLGSMLLLVAGCAPDQRSVEKAVAEGIKSKLQIDIASFELKKREDGGYDGTATAQNGDVYEVTTQPVKEGKVEWQAIPGQAMVEKTVRDGIEKQLGAQVQKLQLTREALGSFTGPAELSNGKTMTIKTRIEGGQLFWEAK